MYYVGNFKCGKVKSKPVGFGMWYRSRRKPRRVSSAPTGNMEAESGLRNQVREKMAVKMAAAQHPRSLRLHLGWREQNGRFCTASILDGWLDHDFEFVFGEIQLSVVAEEEKDSRGWFQFLKSKRTDCSI